MSLFDEIKSSVNEIFPELAEPVIWKNRQMHCIISQGQDGLDLESGGFVSNAVFSIKFNEAELCGDTPRVGEIVAIRDKQYRINWVSNRVGRGQIEVQLKSSDA